MDDNQQQDAQSPEQPQKQGFFARLRERRRLWKAERKRVRDLEKEHYKYAPLGTRVWNLYLKKPVTALAVIAVLAYIFWPVLSTLPETVIGTGLSTYYKEEKNNPVPKEEILKICPADEEGAARIAAIDPVDKDDTWTICVYIVGSNLEDEGENDLSQATYSMVEKMKAEREPSTEKDFSEMFTQYTDELEANGLELPAYLFNPVTPVASSVPVTNDVTVASGKGAASSDISEMRADVWPDNINIVIQTGGATRWGNSSINPNRTQRFLYKQGVFSEVENLPLQPSSVPETLSEFLSYCKDNYPADHTMLILWNHGGGAFGYGNDSIFGDALSLSDIRSALSSVYEPNLDNPAFDIIGFDACLMSSLEVTHALDGFAKYYAVSEETEPGDGWDYTPWLTAMKEDPTMSPARVCQAIADSYMDYYATQNINVGFIFNWDTTFAVLDAAKASELYDAYSELCRAQLSKASQDLSVLAEMGRAASHSTHYAGSAGKIYNTIDLGNYVDRTVDSFPEESAKVKELIGQTVLYHRDSGSTSDSQGISIYFPGSMDSLGSLAYALKYLDGPCESEDVKALYYYKIAGALNEELGNYVRNLTGLEPKKLDVEPFRQYTKTEPTIEETSFSIPMSDDLADMVQDYALEIGAYNELEGTVTNYGRDEYLAIENDGVMHCDFSGEWICLNGIPLAVDMVSKNPSTIEYRSRIDQDGETKYLEFSYDRDTETFEIQGIRELPSTIVQPADEESLNAFVDTKNIKQIEIGDEFTPIYEKTNVEDNTTTAEKGSRSIKFNKYSKIELKNLANGTYLASALISDIRGDDYYSPVVSYTVSGGKVTGCQLDTKFRASTY